MDGTERVTQLRQPHRNTGQSDEIVIRPEAETAAQQRREAQFITPVAVSQTSYLNEKDRHFRAAETVENAGDLVERSVNRVLRIDTLRHEAREHGASPGALAAIERLQEVYAQTSAMLVFDFQARPYERW
jgi:hypothetical protein